MPKISLSSLFFLSAVALAAFPVAASAEEPPNLTGTWTGTITGGARFGDLDYDADEKAPVFADRTKEWVLTIEKQDGSGLIGKWGRDGKSESLVGAIRRNNVNVVFADEDNFFDAQLLSENEMELCGQEVGDATIAVCFLMKRK